MALVEKHAPVRQLVTSIEYQARVDLAALYRLVAHYGMTDLIYNHITARIPGSMDHILINSYGLLYDEVCASNLCVLDLEGNIIRQPEEGGGVNRAGYVIHSAVHAARPDVACVIHTHSRASTAVSAMADGLMPLTQTAMRFYGRVSYHDYEGPALDLDERCRLATDLGSNEVMFLRNHGLLVTGTSIARAFINLFYVENACKMQIDALATGRPLVSCEHEVALRTQEVFGATSLPGVEAAQLGGQVEWAAMLRQLDRIDPSFRN